MSEDAISRQAAIDEMEQSINILEAVDRVMDLPSVNAEPRTGHWKISKIPKGEIVYCSECGFGKYLNEDRKYNYCPNCGAKMEEQA